MVGSPRQRLLSRGTGARQAAPHPQQPSSRPAVSTSAASAPAARPQGQRAAAAGDAASRSAAVNAGFRTRSAAGGPAQDGDAPSTSASSSRAPSGASTSRQGPRSSAVAGTARVATAGGGGGAVLMPPSCTSSASPAQAGRPGAEQASNALRTGLALTWLGTNSGTPTLERNVSCTLVRLPGAVQVVDCGEGSHRQLAAAAAGGGLELADVDGIFITHMHGDHCFGLGAALALLDGAKAAHQPDPARRRHHVYGPPGLAELLRASLALTGAADGLQLPLLITELVCSPANAHGPQPLEAATGAAAAARYTAGARGSGGGGGGGGGAARRAAGREATGAAEQQSGGGDGGGGGGVMVQRLAALHVNDSPQLQAAAAAMGPRVGSLQEIWWPPRGFSSQTRVQQLDAARRGGAAASPYADSESDTELYEMYGGSDSDDDGGAGYGSGAGGWQRRPPPFVASEGLYWEIPGVAGVTVRAAQLQHRVPCWGYVFAESSLPPQAAAVPGAKRRKVVVLGDTVSSKPIAPLAAGCDVVAHEATFAAGMEQKARIAQHSTGAMAGAFAAAVGARALVLTHFSARYREAPVMRDRESRATGRLEMEQQSHEIRALIREAAEAWGPRKAGPPPIFAASDFYTFHVPLRIAPAAAAAAGTGAGQEAEGGGSPAGSARTQPPAAAPAVPQQRAVSGGRPMPRRQVR
ncbi:hypothetical protein HYH02_002923 [Chlamydomonas schloesseri]|uniref:Metallo-beta-lactamase domain-containing protein n=1 Tax=Chlamydomonas schloesseri TaxID=2026947 RepID=A0A836BAH9_9CHLO|nr:hypothetical protein HYH02_002923 [Chlamydomonas schloesseri]|eukprot:KAG2452691.1 hypothetical protein HYH02_002923 [Chlamydomonas schloesseri]